MSGRFSPPAGQRDEENPRSSHRQAFASPSRQVPTTGRGVVTLFGKKGPGSGLRIALDCGSRALRATKVSDALDAVTLLYEEAEKVLRIAERWKRSAG